MNVVLRVEPPAVEALRPFLARAGFRFGERPHVLLFAQREGVTLAAYASGKLLLTGPQAEEYAGVLVANGLAARSPEAPAGRGEGGLGVGFVPHVGTDESGKGDYFGPLCVAAVFVPDAPTAEALLEAGVRDSKTVTLQDAGPLASLVRARCPHRVVVLAPSTYNDLYEQMGNLNDLLAWGHARAIEDLLAEVGDAPVVVDQFARGVLQRHLMARGRAAHVEERVRGESDVAVAAASLVARAEFLAGMARLSSEVGRALPRGAGAPVLAVARELAAARGGAFLREVAKVHFATTGQASAGE